jgi:hypothetical protein
MGSSLQENPMSMSEYFSKRENCNQDILIARKLMGKKGVSDEVWDGMERGLAFMYLYCPPDMQDIVYANLLEAGRRRMLLRL